MLVGLGLKVLFGSLNEHNNVGECSNGVLWGGRGDEGIELSVILTNEVYQTHYKLYGIKHRLMKCDIQFVYFPPTLESKLYNQNRKVSLG